MDVDDDGVRLVVERAGGKLREGYGKAKEKVSETADEIVGDDEEPVR